jgi:hypothetical protein
MKILVQRKTDDKKTITLCQMAHQIGNGEFR